MTGTGTETRVDDEGLEIWRLKGCVHEMEYGTEMGFEIGAEKRNDGGTAAFCDQQRQTDRVEVACTHRTGMRVQEFDEMTRYMRCKAGKSEEVISMRVVVVDAISRRLAHLLPLGHVLKTRQNVDGGRRGGRRGSGGSAAEGQDECRKLEVEKVQREVVGLNDAVSNVGLPLQYRQAHVISTVTV